MQTGPSMVAEQPSRVCSAAAEPPAGYRAKRARLTTACQSPCAQDAPRSSMQEQSCSSSSVIVPTCGADSKQQRHLLVGSPTVSLVRSSSDCNPNDNDHTTNIVRDHSFIHARDEPMMQHTVALARLNSGTGPTSFSRSASSAALGATSKQQRHLPGVPPKVAPCRSHEPGETSQHVESDYGRDANCCVIGNTTTMHPYPSPGSTLPSVVSHMREDNVHITSPPIEEANVVTPPPTSLRHRHPTSPGQRIRCINGNHRCAQTGWTISEYCEACHG